MRTRFYTMMLFATACILLYSSPPAYSQAETHDFVTYDTAISITSCQFCAADKWNVRISRPKNMFVAGNPDTASRPCIFSMPGQGELGSNDVSKLEVYGPHYWLSHGWDGGVTLGNGKHYPILITSCYINNIYPTGVAYYNLLTYLLNTYHIKRNSVHLAGLSQGAFTSGSLILYEETAGAETGMKLVTTLTCFEGTPTPLPAPYSTWDRGYTGYKIWAKKYGGRYFYLEGSGSDNFRDGWHYADAMNDTVPGSAYFSYEGLGGGAHCCWNSMYDPSATNWTSVGTLGPNNTPSQVGKNSMGDYKAPSSVFQWMLKHGDSSLVGSAAPPPPAPVPPPTVSAGIDQSITLPINSVTLTGTASETNGTIASYAWSQVSGPSTATWTTPNQASAKAGSLIEGVYKFQLLVKDGLGNPATATVQVTVNAAAPPAPVPPPTVSAGIDQSITLPINSVTLTGTASETNGTIASYAWSQLSGPSTATWSTPDQAGATAGGLVEGVYKFQLLVKDGLGNPATATVQVTVNAAIVTPPAPVPPPTVNAGIDQSITLPINSVTLTGTASETNGTIASYAWSQLIGPSTATWSTPDQAGATAGGLVEGVYKFQLLVKDGLGNPATATVQVTVNAAIVTPPAPVPPPTVNAGIDQNITLPISSVTLTGTASETNGTIASYAWSQLSGPSTATWAAADQAQALASNLVEGVYKFQLLVKDGLGNPATATVQVTVNAAIVTPPAPVPPPTVSAGIDQSITLPINSVTLTGTASETNGTIASYAWSQLIGPSTATWSTPDQAGATAGNLVQGIYKFQLLVKDGLGNPATATVQVTVNAAIVTPPPPPPTGPANGIKHVVVSEYRTWYITNDGKIWAYNNNSSYPVQFNIGGLKADTGAGGFNYFRIIDEQGFIWNSQIDWTTNTNRIDKDTTGAPFNGNRYVDAYGDVALTIRSDSSVWYFGLDGYSLFYPGANLNRMTGTRMAPTQLSPAGWKFKKVLLGYDGILGLTTTGEVYKWYNNGSRTPTLIPTVRPAIDIFISHLAVNGVIIPDPGGSQTMGYPYIWGDVWGGTSSMWGATGVFNTPTPVKALWKMNAPIKEMSVDWNTIHYIDSLGNMYGCGYNSFGEVGNGQEFINKYNYPGFPSYEWTVVDYENPSGIPVQIGAGVKWKHLYANNWFGFYKYGMDEHDSIYSWGRNKSLVLGNGLWNGYDGGAYHPNTLDVLKPTMVHPLVSLFTEYGYIPPTISVGPKQIISTPTATLTGVAKALLCISVKKPSPNGIDTVGYHIVSYLWTKVSGAGGVITSPNAATTTVTGLSNGTYVFNLLTTDNNTGTLSANDTIIVTSSVPGQLIVSAGNAQTITLPTNSVTLTGTASEVNGTIASYKWTQVSGPSTAGITASGQAQTTVTALVQGVYRFQLLVTDALGTTATATVQVTVNPAPIVPGPPSANAGSDQTITLPTNNVTLTGSGAETNGTIVSYSWTQISGPSTAGLGTAGQSQTAATGLIEGVYVFQLKVTDNSGVTATDVTQVTVKPVVPVPGTPVADAGQDQTITLPTSSVTLTGSGSETNGTIASYAWSQVSGPSTASIPAPGQAQTDVSGLVEGIYRFKLLVTDALGNTASATVQVTVKPAPIVPGAPSASAGSDQTITLPTNSVTLNGSGSESNGTIISYSWEKTSGPAAGAITSAGQAQTTVTGLVQGVYTFKLTVTDNSGVTATDVITVTVNPAPILPGTPAANAGQDQTITLPKNSVTLSGSGSVTNSTIVSYSWEQAGGPSQVTITSAGQAQTNVTGFEEGTYSFRLTVKSDAGISATDLVTVTVLPSPASNKPPVANAGPAQTVAYGTATVSLDGTGSYDPDGSITKYAWVQLSGAGGVTIVNSNTSQPTVYGLKTGVYTFQLTVTDNNGVTASATVTITVSANGGSTAQAPVAVVSKDTTVFFPNGNNAILDGSASYDPGGTIKDFSWKQLSGPVNVQIANSGSAVGAVSDLPIGDYVFQLTVTNTSGITNTASMSVHVKDNGRTSDVTRLYPNPAQTGQHVTVDGSNSYIGRVTFNIMDIQGRVVKSVIMDKHEPTFSQTIYLGGLGRGTYVVWVQFYLDQKPTSLKLVID